MKTNLVLLIATVVSLTSCDMAKHYATKRIQHSADVTSKNIAKPVVQETNLATGTTLLTDSIQLQTQQAGVTPQTTIPVVAAKQKIQTSASTVATNKKHASNFSAEKKTNTQTRKKLKLKKIKLLKGNTASAQSGKSYDWYDFWDDWGGDLMVLGIILLIAFLTSLGGILGSIGLILQILLALAAVVAGFWFIWLLFYIFIGMWIGMDAPWGL